jgi:hypothetical protein
VVISSGGPLPPKTYLFIDGAYLRARYREAMRGFYGQDGELDLGAVQQLCGHRIEKAFYYDCTDEKKAGETEQAFTVRKIEEHKFLETIQSLPGFHVYRGTLAGRRQKEVDVALAVDMLTHAFNKNMERATLIAGDLDFRPVVEALVRLGVYVTLISVKSTVARDLQWAADQSVFWGFHELYGASSATFKSANPIPVGVNGSLPGSLGDRLRCGCWQGKATYLHKYDGSFALIVDQYANNMPLHITFGNREGLEKYFATVYGPIDWEAT